jgi:general stress protein 26
MAQPRPEPVDPARLPELARAAMAAAKFPMLATLDGDQPRLRPVSPVKTEGFTIYVANLRSYGKTGQIAANPKVELCYLDKDHDQVRITGNASVVTDRDTLESIWNENPLLRSYLGSIDNPELIIYRITPERVRFMREWALEYHEVSID